MGNVLFCILSSACIQDLGTNKMNVASLAGRSARKDKANEEEEKKQNQCCYVS